MKKKFIIVCIIVVALIALVVVQQYALRNRAIADLNEQNVLKNRIKTALGNTDEARDEIVELLKVNYIALNNLEKEIKEFCIQNEARILEASCDTGDNVLCSFSYNNNELLFVLYNSFGIFSEYSAYEIFSSESVEFCRRALVNGWQLRWIRNGLSDERHLTYLVFTTAPRDIYVDIRVGVLSEETVNSMTENSLTFDSEFRAARGIETPVNIVDDLYLWRSVEFMP